MIRKLLLLLLPVMSALSAAAQHTLVIRSDTYPKADTVLYFVPGGYAADGKIPAALLLHGYGGSPRQWMGVAPLQTLADEYGMMLICPDGFRESWYIDAPGGGDDFATFMSQSVIPGIIERLPVDTSLFFVTGLSMGGHGSIQMMLRCPGLFAAVGSMSGVMDLRESALSKTCLARLLGPKSGSNANWARYSAVDNVQAVKDAGTPIIISCGAQDYLIEANRTFARKCGAMGVDIVYMESPGRHENKYWRITLPEHLRFFRKFVNKRNNN